MNGVTFNSIQPYFVFFFLLLVNMMKNIGMQTIETNMIGDKKIPSTSLTPSQLTVERFTFRQTNWWTNLWKQDALICTPCHCVVHCTPSFLATTILCYRIIYFYGRILFRSSPLSVISAKVDQLILYRWLDISCFGFLFFFSTWINNPQSTTNTINIHYTCTSATETLFLWCNLKRFYISIVYCFYLSSIWLWYLLYNLISDPCIGPQMIIRLSFICETQPININALSTIQCHSSICIRFQVSIDFDIFDFVWMNSLRICVHTEYLYKWCVCGNCLSHHWLNSMHLIKRYNFQIVRLHTLTAIIAAFFIRQHEIRDEMASNHHSIQICP